MTALYITGGGLSINMYHGSYGVAIVIDSVIVEETIGNVCIYGKETEFPTYNVTINEFTKHPMHKALLCSQSSYVVYFENS